MWQMRKIRLWEKAGWIIIRSRETARKLGLYMEEERDMRYEKFQTTGQERIRLACALEGFFLTNECEKEKKTAYGQYLKRRIRPAMEALIREENVGKMELLKSFGWFGAEELENFICTARRERKLESLVWLMRLKDQKYGYKEKKFNL